MHISALFICLAGASSAFVAAHPDVHWYRQQDLIERGVAIERAPEVVNAATIQRRGCSGKSRHRAAIAVKAAGGNPVALHVEHTSARTSAKTPGPHHATPLAHHTTSTTKHRKHHTTTTKKTAHHAHTTTKAAAHHTPKAMPKEHTTKKHRTTTKKHEATKKHTTHKSEATKKASSGTKASLSVKSGSSGSGSSSGGGSSFSSKGSSGKGLFGVSTSQCGASGATEGITQSSGPNGAESWLNCGFSPANPSSGWTPPYIQISQLRARSLDDALNMANSVFSACKPYVYLFDKYGSELGLPPILLASIAMQESSCKADTMGDQGGAWGLMQITSDKCGGAPSGNCADPDYNISTGARYLKSLLDQQGGDVLVSLGMYNGWYKGLTYNGATAVRDSCYVCQNNADYHHQMLNGWMQGIDGSRLGTIRNIA